jgi:hypothetical protein
MAKKSSASSGAVCTSHTSSHSHSYSYSYSHTSSHTCQSFYLVHNTNVEYLIDLPNDDLDDD